MEQIMIVKAYIGSQIAHVSQIFTGLAMLERGKLLSLRFDKDSLLGKSSPLLRVEINGKHLIFDLADGFNIDKDLYKDSDLYFKRMLNSEDTLAFPRLHPYGLNYPVYIAGDHLMKRIFLTSDVRYISSNIIRHSILLSKILNINLSYANSSVKHFEGEVKVKERPTILYYTRLWNPDKSKDASKKAQRIQMNELRKDLVLALRKKFKDNFQGGLYRSEFSVAFAPTATVPNNRQLHKTRYLQSLRHADVCIADPGLEMSVGFKLGEYVAMSKAIVSTPVNTILPGDFAEGKNYLCYKNIEQCLAQCEHLLEHRDAIFELQQSNYQYYRNFLRPDTLIWNCITKAL